MRDFITTQEILKQTHLSRNQFKLLRVYGLIPTPARQVSLGSKKGLTFIYPRYVLDDAKRILNWRRQGHSIENIRSWLKTYREGISPQEKIVKTALDQVYPQVRKFNDLDKKLKVALKVAKRQKTLPRTIPRSGKRKKTKVAKDSTKSDEDGDGSDDLTSVIGTKRLKSRDVLRLSRLFLFNRPVLIKEIVNEVFQKILKNKEFPSGDEKIETGEELIQKATKKSQ